MFSEDIINWIYENPTQHGKKSLIREKWPDEYNEIIQCDGKTWHHKLYNYLHPDIKHICPVCGKETPFKCFSKGYCEFCSHECISKSKDVVKRREDTMLRLYGEKYSSQVPEFKEKIKKTNIEKFGVDSPLKSKEIQEKVKNTNMERYGVEWTLQNKDVREYARRQIISKYGVENVSQSDEIKEKKRQTFLKHYGVESGPQSPEVKEKLKNTVRERYGVDYYLSSDEKKIKEKNTNLMKYGVEHAAQSEVVKEKMKLTNIEHFGTPYASSSEVVRRKVENTCMERYGVKHVSQDPEVREKMSTSLRKTFMKNNPDIVDIQSDENGLLIYTVKCPHIDTCNKCSEKQFKIKQSLYSTRRYQKVELCTTLLPITGTKYSSLELKVRSWLDDLGISYITNDRSLIPPKEIDIYIPSKHLAIEVNGIFWHSDKNKPIKYHMEKWQLLHEKGVQMLTLWEDQLLNHEEIMHNILLSKLGVYERRVGARKCSLRQVPGKEARAFLDQFHLQGHAGAKVNLGLYYNDTLVSLMTFGHRQVGHGWDNRSWELVRYCCRAGWQVVGGPSRQLRHFIKEYRPDSISSFSSNDISDGGLYTALGFESAGSAAPGYWYIDPEDYHRYHRYTFTKDQILHKGLAPSPDKSTWTERQVMDAWGYVRIYDSGQSKWKLECKYE